MTHDLGTRAPLSSVPATDALLLVGHGSARYPDAARVLHRHAETLRQAGHRVEIGLLNGTPTVADALARLDARPIRVVPFFMEDGYFTRIAIPRAVSHDSRVRICPPVGIHDGIGAILARQAHQACVAREIRPEDAAILLVGHGSAKAPGRALALHRHAAGLNGFARSQAACLEESPLLPDALRALQAYPVIVIGFFANRGTHVRDDVPAAIAAQQRRDIQFHGSVTDDPAMTSIILDQAQRTVPATDKENLGCLPM